MLTKTTFVVGIALFNLCGFPNALFAQGTAFTYQGQLVSGGLPANGNYDLAFALYASTNGGNPVAAPVTNTATLVSNGLFTVPLDFGPGVFTGSNYWLQVSVQTNGGGGFTPLSPLQPITPTPYALYAPNAGASASAASVAGSNIIGSIPLAQLPAAVVTNGASGVILNGAFSGIGTGLGNLTPGNISAGTAAINISGSAATASAAASIVSGATLSNIVITNSSYAGNGFNVTNLNANNLANGTISLARLPSQVVTNTESGVTLTGAFSGNGAGLTNLNASNLVSGTLSSSLLPSNVLTTVPTVLQSNVYSSAGTNTVIVPSGATVMIAKLWGAGGGGGGDSVATGGGGAFVQQTISVVAGQTFTVVVGQHGNYNNSNAGGNGSGDAAGGSTGSGDGSGQGGQASSLFYFNGSTYITEAVAGGGGAGSAGSGGAGGNPGQTGGTSGGAGGNNGLGGSGGVAGGNYASGATNTGIASLGSAGGNGGGTSSGLGGGGGGFGGGGSGNGSTFGGGGGGGSYGSLVIAGTNNAAGNTGDLSYVSPNGTGGTELNPGADGLVVISFTAPGAVLPGTITAAGLTVTATITAASFSGSGANLTNLNASSVKSGTLSSIVLPPNLQTLNSNNAVNLTNIQAAALPTNVLFTVPANLQTNAYSPAGTATVIVPLGATLLTAKLWGAGGGGGGAGATGGGGAFAQQTISVVAGQTFTVVVGQHGNYNNNNAGGNGSGDASGGSTGAGAGSGQGGQASSLFYFNGASYITEALAGGGGGGSAGAGGAGGNPGQTGGQSGGAGGYNGSGGAAGSGGTAGNNYASGAATTGISSPGSANGDGGGSSAGLGGGGGGYGGGGSGNSSTYGGGGGGGSYGSLVIAGTNTAAGNSGDPFYISSQGTGGAAGNAGVDGLVVLIFSGSEAATSGRIAAAAFTGDGGGLTGVALLNSNNSFTGLQSLYGGFYMNSTNGYHQSSLGLLEVDSPGVFGGRLIVATNGNVGIGMPAPAYPLQMGSGAYCSAAGVWTSVSDRNVKENFEAITPSEVLAKVVGLSITQWKYKVEPAGLKHIGPVAQDFHAAFGLGDSDKAIGSVDETGVALAAIQGLNQKLEKKDAEIEQLKQSVAELKTLVLRLSTKPESLSNSKLGNSHSEK